MLGVMSETLFCEDASTSGDVDFFSVARTMPLVAVRESADGGGRRRGGKEDL